jgi:hypothetical protein
MISKRIGFLVVVLFAFGLCVAVPARDLPETAYDESEPAPFAAAPLISEFIKVSTTGALAEVIALHQHEETSTRSDLRCGNRDKVRESRPTMALFCSFLC